MRGNYWIVAEEKERGQEDIEKAYQLDPEDADVYSRWPSRPPRMNSSTRPASTWTPGKKLHPEDPRFYQASADLESTQGKYKEAIAEIETGLKAVGTQKGGVLLFYKAESAASQQGRDGRPRHHSANEGRRLPAGDHRLARSADPAGGRKVVYEAAGRLHRLRPRMTDIGDMSTQIDFFLGMCHERLRETRARQAILRIGAATGSEERTGEARTATHVGAPGPQEGRGFRFSVPRLG